MRFALLAAIAPLALIACATAADSRVSDEAELATELAGRTAGKPVRCIDPASLNNPEFIGDKTLVYRQSRRRIWVNTLPDKCPFIRGDSIPVFRLYGSQLCSGDFFETIDRASGFRGGNCRLGDFVPYEKPPATR